MNPLNHFCENNLEIGKSVNFTELLPKNHFLNNYPKAQCRKMKTLRTLISLKKKNSSNQLFSNFFSKNVNFTKFLPKKGESKFP